MLKSIHPAASAFFRRLIFPAVRNPERVPVTALFCHRGGPAKRPDFFPGENLFFFSFFSPFYASRHAAGNNF